MNRVNVYCAIFLMFALTITGCKKNDQTALSSVNEKADSNATVPIGQTETNLNKENTMLAKVNGTPITSEEVKRELDNVMAQYQNKIPPEQLQSLLPKLKTQALENLINTQLLFAEADRKEIKPSSDEINSELDSIISRFPSPEVFQQQLTKTGITREQMLKDIEQQLKVNTLVKESLNGVEITVTEKEVSEFYQENPDNFRSPEQVRASHVLLKSNPDDDPMVKSQKRLELAGLRGKIEDGADFAKIAEEHSECPSKQQGGDLGFFERGKMVKSFEEVAFALEVGEVSDVVESQFGYHIIKVSEHQEARTIPLDEVNEKISTYLKNTKEQQAVNTYLGTLREKADIEYAEAGKKDL